MCKDNNYLKKHLCVENLLFLLAITCVASKCILFHFFCFDQIVISSLWTNLPYFIQFYLPKFIISIFISSFIFIFSNNKWVIPMLFFWDIWMISQLVYFNANKMFMDLYVISMAGNMDGFWSSIKALFYVQYWLFPITSLIVVFCYMIVTNNACSCVSGGVERV